MVNLSKKSKMQKSTIQINVNYVTNKGKLLRNKLEKKGKLKNINIIIEEINCL